MFYRNQFSSVAQSCPTLCDPINCSMPGLPVHHQLPEFTQTHVHQVSAAINHLILCHPLLLLPSIFPASGFFLMSQFFTSGGQRTGVSASASVIPMNIQDWFPLGWTGLLSLQSKGLSRVFSNSTIQKYQFFGAQLSLWITGKTIALTRWTFIGKVMSLLFNMLSRLVINFFPSSKHFVNFRNRKTTSKLIWNHKSPWIGKAILRKKNSWKHHNS